MLAPQASYTGSIPVSRSRYNMVSSSWSFYRSMVLAFLCLGLAGCATVRQPPSPPVPGVKPVPQVSITHKVNKGETLWRIAKTYKVSVEDIIQANHIPNAASIERGQLLIIPGAVEAKDVLLAPSPGGKDIDYDWPLKGRVISYFEDRKGAGVNQGIDIQGGDGEPVKAAREGRVVFADHLAGNSSTIILDHADGFFTVYGHNDRLLVKLGDYVFKGEKLAQLGQSGAFEHFEVRKGDRPKNPLHYLPREM